MAKKTLTLVTGIDEEKNEVITQDYPYPIFVKGSLVKKAIDLGVELEKLGEENVDSGVVDDLADFAVELYKIGRASCRDGGRRRVSARTGGEYEDAAAHGAARRGTGST